MELTLIYYGLKMELDLSKLMVLRQEGWWMGVLPVMHKKGSFLCNLHFDVTSFRTHPLVKAENQLNLPGADTRTTIEESLVWSEFLPSSLSQFRREPIQFSSRSVEEEWGRPISTLEDGCLQATILLGHQQDGLPILLGARLRDLFVIHHLAHLEATGVPCQTSRQTRIQRTKSSSLLHSKKTLEHLFVTMLVDLHDDEALIDPIEGQIFRECCLYGLRSEFLCVDILHDALCHTKLSVEAQEILKKGLESAQSDLEQMRAALSNGQICS